MDKVVESLREGRVSEVELDALIKAGPMTMLEVLLDFPMEFAGRVMTMVNRRVDEVLYC